MSAPSPKRLERLIDSLEAGLLERDAATRLALLAALAGEHVLLIGPPGTAKSELARRLHRVFADAPYFERLLTRFSTPEELFGPLSLKALEDDRYERLIDGFLPTAGIGFLDEVFKANSAILNALLTLLNEREFDNGSARLRVPLISVVAASNEVPVDEALRAFFDRFLLRVPVQPVSDQAFAGLLDLRPASTAAIEPLRLGERQALALQAQEVHLGPAALEACHALRRWLQRESIVVSDRRWRQWVDLMRTAAAAEGRASVDAMDLWTAPYVVSPSPESVPQVEQWFAADLMQCQEQDLQWLVRAVEAFEKQLEIEESAPSETASDDGAGKLALARAISGNTDSGAAGDGMLRMVSRQVEKTLRRHYSSVHVAARLAQLDEMLGQTRQARESVEAQRDALLTAMATRLWMPPSLKQQLVHGHTRTVARLEALSERLDRCHQAFADLPIDDRLTPVEPEPVVLQTPA